MSTSSSRARRSTSIALVLFLSFGVVAAATACDPVSRDWAWRAGKTHGAIIETTAGRASLGIYRVPSRFLYGWLQRNGIRKTQDLMWNVGKPPELRKTFSYRGRSLTISLGATTKQLRDFTHKLIYDDPNDLATSIQDAQKHGSCVALTLLSYGRLVSNWTQKSVGCRDGSLP